MRIFRQIKIKLKNSKSKQIKLFDAVVFKKIKYNAGRGKDFCAPDKSKPVFYLKMNKRDNYSLSCLEHWLKIIEILNCDFYIICDKEDLEAEIFTMFAPKNIKFIRSAKKPLDKIVQNISTPHWTKATYAHLTAFYHAKQNNIKNFWNIDADDTMFLTEPAAGAEIIKKAEDYAGQKDISAFSLDMHTSYWKGRHWSWGVAYVRGNRDYFEIFNNNKDSSWQERYLGVDAHFNLDWFFTYLNSGRIVKAETFYIENLYFMHTGDFFRCPTNASITFWENGKLNFPILVNVFGSKELGIVPIADSCVKLDLNIKQKDCFGFLLNNFCVEKYYPYFLRKNIGLDTVFPKKEEPPKQRDYDNKKIWLFGLPIYEREYTPKKQGGAIRTDFYFCRKISIKKEIPA